MMILLAPAAIKINTLSFDRLCNTGSHLQSFVELRIFAVLYDGSLFILS